MKNLGSDEVTVEIEGARVTLHSETIAAIWLDSIRNESALAQRAVRKIGDQIAGGEYMGIVRLDDGTERAVIDLGEAPSPMKYAAAEAWCREKGGQLPPRRAQSLMFANRREGQFKDRYYWAIEQCAGDGGYAWVQGFGSGGPGDGPKDYGYYVRAVRLVDPSVIQ